MEEIYSPVPILEGMKPVKNVANSARSTAEMFQFSHKASTPSYPTVGPELGKYRHPGLP